MEGKGVFVTLPLLLVLPVCLGQASYLQDKMFYRPVLLGIQDTFMWHGGSSTRNPKEGQPGEGIPFAPEKSWLVPFFPASL